MITIRTLLVPVRLLLGTAKISARAGYRTAKAGAVVGTRTVVGSTKLGYTAGRAVGYGRMAVFGGGVAVGVVIASPRARAGAVRIGTSVWALVKRTRGPSDREIGEQVRRRLAGGQATWDLPQPTITVDDGLVRLDGGAPDAGGRRAIAEAASAVEGVREVDNRVVVIEPGPEPDRDLGATSGNGAEASTSGASS